MNDATLRRLQDPMSSSSSSSREGYEARHTDAEEPAVTPVSNNNNNSGTFHQATTTTTTTKSIIPAVHHQGMTMMTRADFDHYQEHHVQNNPATTQFIESIRHAILSLNDDGAFVRYAISPAVLTDDWVLRVTGFIQQIQQQQQQRNNTSNDKQKMKLRLDITEKCKYYTECWLVVKVMEDDDCATLTAPSKRVHNNLPLMMLTKQLKYSLSFHDFLDAALQKIHAVLVQSFGPPVCVIAPPDHAQDLFVLGPASSSSRNWISNNSLSNNNNKAVVAVGTSSSTPIAAALQRFKSLRNQGATNAEMMAEKHHLRALKKAERHAAAAARNASTTANGGGTSSDIVPPPSSSSSSSPLNAKKRRVVLGPRIASGGDTSAKEDCDLEAPRLIIDNKNAGKKWHGVLGVLIADSTCVSGRSNLIKSLLASVMVFAALFCYVCWWANDSRSTTLTISTVFMKQNQDQSPCCQQGGQQNTNTMSSVERPTSAAAQLLVCESSLNKATGIRKYLHKPKRPLSAYNHFFKEQKQKILNDVLSDSKFENNPESEDYFFDHDMIRRLMKKDNDEVYDKLGKIIGQRWHRIDRDSFAKYSELAREDRERYAKEREVYENACIMEGKAEAVMHYKAGIPPPIYRPLARPNKIL